MQDKFGCGAWPTPLKLLTHLCSTALSSEAHFVVAWTDPPTYQLRMSGALGMAVKRKHSQMMLDEAKLAQAAAHAAAAASPAAAAPAVLEPAGKRARAAEEEHGDGAGASWLARLGKRVTSLFWPDSDASASVKVGDGEYIFFEHPRLMTMRSGQLLTALAKEDIFRVKLQGVPLDDCTVRIVKSTSKVPSPAEEAAGAAVELTASDTLADHALPEGAKFFIRVQLPPVAAPRADRELLAA